MDSHNYGYLLFCGGIMKYKGYLIKTPNTTKWYNRSAVIPNPNLSDIKIIISDPKYGKQFYIHELAHIMLILKGFNLTWAIENNVTLRKYEALVWSVAAKFSKEIDTELASFCINTYEDIECSFYLGGEDWQYLKSIGVIKKK